MHPKTTLKINDMTKFKKQAEVETVEEQPKAQMTITVAIPVDEWNAQRADTIRIRELMEKFNGERDEDGLTIDEVCEIAKISRPTFHRWKNEGKLPTYKVGKRVFVKRNELEKIL